jgi:integrase
MDEMTRTKTAPTLIRYKRAMQDRAFDIIRDVPILETHSAQFLKVLEIGSVATNVFLRRLHNFALDMSWLPWPVLAKKQWPKVRFKEKRAITWKEHQAIITAETNPERRAFYELCWFLGGSQKDIAELKAEDVDWSDYTLSFIRNKLRHLADTGIKPPIIHFGEEVTAILKSLPARAFW